MLDWMKSKLESRFLGEISITSNMQITPPFFFKFYFYFILLCNTVLVLPYIDMNPPRVYMRSQTWTPLPPPTPYHLSGSSPCTSPKHAVSYVEHRLAIRFLHDSIHVSMPFSQIISPSHSFTSGWPVFPAPLVKEIVFSPLFIFASFVKDMVSMIFDFSLVSWGNVVLQ